MWCFKIACMAGARHTWWAQLLPLVLTLLLLWHLLRLSHSERRVREDIGERRVGVRREHRTSLALDDCRHRRAITSASASLQQQPLLPGA